MEFLEPRVLLSAVQSAGSEFQVNTYTTSDQKTPAVATDANGNYVVAWASNGQNGNNDGIYAQRYNSSGVAQGSEFLVNTYTTSLQQYPSVAMDADGDFVVTWQSNGQDGSSWGVYAQRYDSSGVAQGSEFQVNTYTTNHQSYPSVAMDSTGDFIVTWQSYGQDGSSKSIYAQRYNSTGTAQGSEFQVNTYTTGSQISPAVAMDSAGDFVVTWSSYGQDGTPGSIYAQRYDSTGTPQGSEFQVNTYTTNAQFRNLVTMDAAGDFVVTWTSDGQDGDNYGIYAQRYAAGHRPTDISLDNASVAENQPSGTTVGTFSTTDADSPESFTYSLVSGTGDTDNGSFTIDSSGNLLTAASFNYEAQTSYSILIQVTDSGGLTLTKQFTISVTDSAPTDIQLSNDKVPENSPVGTEVATITASDPDQDGWQAYSLVPGTGNDDNGRFTINGDKLVTKLANFNYETKKVLSIRLRVTDQEGLTYDKVFTINVTNVNEAPTDIQLSNDCTFWKTRRNDVLKLVST